MAVKVQLSAKCYTTMSVTPTGLEPVSLVSKTNALPVKLRSLYVQEVGFEPTFYSIKNYRHTIRPPLARG